MAKPSVKMSSDDPVWLIADRVFAWTGNQFEAKHKDMIVSRVQKRLVQLNLPTIDAYLKYIDKNEETERPQLISLLTTHHTYFFREYAQLELLGSKILEKVVQNVKAKGGKKIRIWSAACSRGQEAYSMAMILDQKITQNYPEMDFEIYGSDIDQYSVDFAKNAVYPWKEIKEVPMHFLSKYVVRGSGDLDQFAKIKKNLTSKCSFGSVNLLEYDPNSFEKFDIIFCRNIFIYLNSEQISTVTKKFVQTMAPTGFLFLGISESLIGLNLPLKISGPSIYVRSDDAALKAHAAAVTQTKKPEAAAPAENKVFRILCVDDSPTVLALLKKVLDAKVGFEIVGTAKNGIEAASAVKTLKPDAMTLDIHMPEQDGISYLRANYKQGHPPVIMVSSVSRENSDLAIQALEYGASDYVEKPSMTNLQEKAEEIRNKIKSAVRSHAPAPNHLELDRSIASKFIPADPENQIRVLVGALADRTRITQVLKELKGVQPPTVLLLEGVTDTTDKLSAILEKTLGIHLELLTGNQVTLKPGTLYFADIKSYLKILREQFAKRHTSICVFGMPSDQATDEIIKWPKAQLLLEELPDGAISKRLKPIASDHFPATSFAAISTEYFSKKRSVV